MLLVLDKFFHSLDLLSLKNAAKVSESWEQVISQETRNLLRYSLV